MYANKELGKERIQAVRQMYVAVGSLRRYLSRHALLRPEEEQALRTARDPVQLNRHMRQIVARMRSPGHSGLLWHAIDASGFIDDATPGRWPYTQECQWRRYLQWAREYCDDLMVMLKVHSTKASSLSA